MARLVSRRQVIKGALAAGAGSAASVAWPGGLGAIYTAVDQLVQPNDLAGTRIWASLPAGAGAGQLGILDLEGMRPDGPKAIVARPNGDIAILDTLNARVVLLREGRVRVTVPLPDSDYPVDLEESQGRLWVLDNSRAKIFEIDGTFVRAHALPNESVERATRLASDPLGIAVVEQDYLSYALAAGRAALREGIPGPTSGSVRISYPRNDLARKAVTFVPSLGPAVSVTTQHWLGSGVPMGNDAQGRSYVLIAQLLRGVGATVAVALSLHRFARDGSPAGVARVPVRGRRSQPRRPVTFTPQGDAYALFPEAGRTLVVQLDWTSAVTAARLAPRIEQAQGLALAVQNIPASRAQSRVNAAAYHNHQWWCSTNNFSNDGCRVKPGYITQANAYYYEIPYDWGGWDSLSEFDSQMSEGRRAGNAQGAFGSCSLSPGGVDCSGYLGRAWGITGTRYADWQLVDEFVTNRADLVPSNPPPWMQVGDAYDWRGQHIMMHDEYSPWGNGVQVYESALSNGSRVWHPFYTWAELDSYEWCIGRFTS